MSAELDDQVRALIAENDRAQAATLTLREYGAEIFGFLAGLLNEADADEVFSVFSYRLWRSFTSFEGRCSLRTWCYVLARRELSRFRKGARNHARRRVPISQFQDACDAVRTASRSAFATAKRSRLAALRAALPEHDRELLILRIDRNLAWDDIALAFADDPEGLTAAVRQREAARLRKRFQLVKDRLKQQLTAHSRATDAPAT